MPFVRNKILINDLLAWGMSLAIKSTYKAANKLVKEIESHGWLQEPAALKFKDEAEDLCIVYDKAQMDHLVGLRELVETMRKWVDSKLPKP